MVLVLGTQEYFMLSVLIRASFPNASEATVDFS